MAVADHPLYEMWRCMKRRCSDPSFRGYQYYGGRGITVCDRWKKSFLTFVADMGPKPPGHTIERIDNEKGYGPDNCKWATPRENCRNKRNNVRLTANGKTQVMAAWVDESGLPTSTIAQRVSRGWSAQKAVTAPRNPNGRRLVTANGKTQSISAWSRETGLRIDTISKRLCEYGWTEARAVTTPPSWSRRPGAKKHG